MNGANEPAANVVPADDRVPDEQVEHVNATDVRGLCSNFPACCIDGDNKLKVDQTEVDENDKPVREIIHLDEELENVITFLMNDPKNFKLKTGGHGSIGQYQELLRQLYENKAEYVEKVFLAAIRNVFKDSKFLVDNITRERAMLCLSHVMLLQKGGASQGGHYGANEAYRFFVANWDADGFKDIIALTRPGVDSLSIALKVSKDANAADEDIASRVLYCLKKVQFNPALDQASSVHFYFRLKSLLKEGREMLQLRRQGSIIPYLREKTLGESVANALDALNGFFAMELGYNEPLQAQQPFEEEDPGPFQTNSAPFFTRTYRKIRRVFHTLFSPLRWLDSRIQETTGLSIYSGLSFVFSSGLLATRWAASANAAFAVTTAAVTSGITIVSVLSCFAQFTLLAGMTLNVLEVIGPRWLQDYTIVKVMKKITTYVQYAELAYNIYHYFLGDMWNTVSSMVSANGPDSAFENIAPGNETIAIINNTHVTAETLSKTADFFNVEHATMCSIMANDADRKTASDGVVLLLSSLTLYLKDRTALNVHYLQSDGKRHDDAFAFFKNSAVVLKRVLALLEKHPDLLTKAGPSLFVSKLKEGLALFETLGDKKRDKNTVAVGDFAGELLKFWGDNGPEFVKDMTDASTLVKYMNELKILQESDLRSQFPSADLIASKIWLLVVGALMIIGLYVLAKYVGAPLARSKLGVWGSGVMKTLVDAWNKGKVQPKEETPTKVYSIDDYGIIHMRELPKTDPDTESSEWGADILWGIFGITSGVCLLLSVLYKFGKTVTLEDFIKGYVGWYSLKSWHSAATAVGPVVGVTTSRVILNTTNVDTAMAFMHAKRQSGSNVEGAIMTIAEASGRYGLKAVVGITQLLIDTASASTLGLKMAFDTVFNRNSVAM